MMSKTFLQNCTATPATARPAASSPSRWSWTLSRQKGWSSGTGTSPVRRRTSSPSPSTTGSPPSPSASDPARTPWPELPGSTTEPIIWWRSLSKVELVPSRWTKVSSWSWSRRGLKITWNTLATGTSEVFKIWKRRPVDGSRRGSPVASSLLFCREGGSTSRGIPSRLQIW